MTGNKRRELLRIDNKKKKKKKEERKKERKRITYLYERKVFTLNEHASSYK